MPFKHIIICLTSKNKVINKDNCELSIDIFDLFVLNEINISSKGRIMNVKRKNNFKLTEREMDILNILWSSDKPLIASDIAKTGNSLSINTVQAVLRNLLSKKLVEVADVVYSGTVISPLFLP